MCRNSNFSCKDSADLILWQTKFIQKPYQGITSNFVQLRIITKTTFYPYKAVSSCLVLLSTTLINLYCFG